MKQDIRRLPDSELELMQIIWDREPPVTRPEIEEALAKTHPLAPTTILTFLTRLCDKGFLKLERRGKVNYYTPIITRKAYLAQASRGVLDQLFGGSVAALATSLVDAGVSRGDRDADAVPGALDRDARDGGRRALEIAVEVRRKVLDELANLEVLVELRGIVLARRIPLGAPVFGNGKTETDRINFLSHSVM